jgi:tyrosyl-tRNA synthetase
METEISREQLVESILNRGVVVNVLPDVESFKKRLLSTDPMKIYIGADPTSTALHLSHAKNYMVLEEIRKLGHEVIVLFGDFTARIGDPTGNAGTRKQLSSEDVNKNVQGWIRQIKPLMDFDAKDNPPKIVYNSEWLSKLTMEDVINLASNVTVQQMIERDMFAKRIKEQKPIGLHEFLYPLMQGYDSVALDVDAELCGTDQTFNALVGRTLQKKLNNKEKFVVTVNLMENPKTKELMSKSRGTGIFLDYDAFNMYGSIMSQPDEMIKVFLINNTRMPLEQIEEILKADNPMDAKKRTALEITKIFHGEEEAVKAEEKFVNLVQKKSASENIPEVKAGSSKISLISLIKKCIPETSSNEIRRLIDQGSIKINGEKSSTDINSLVSISEDGIEVKVGKKKWFKIIP